MRFLFALVLLWVVMPVFANNGKALHDNVCIECHRSLTGGKPTSLYTRAERSVENLSALDKQVKRCAIAADANWSEQQRRAVVEYLSKQFYQFN